MNKDAELAGTNNNFGSSLILPCSLFHCLANLSAAIFSVASRENSSSSFELS